MNRQGGNGFRVLVVDDDPDQLALLNTYLRRAGCTVTTAVSGELAVEVLDQPFDLAIVDLLLPGIGGGEVAAELRSRQPRCRIAVTSVLDAEEYPPADALLPKPFTRSQVLALLPRTQTPVEAP